MNQIHVTDQPNRLVPNAVDAERALLSSLIIVPDDLFELALEPCQFYLERHGEIFAAMQGLLAKNTPLDYLTLSTELKERGKLDERYLDALVTDIPASLNTRAYAAEIVRADLKRKILYASTKIAAISYDSHGLTDEEMLSKAHQELMGVEARQSNADGVSMYDAVGDFIPDLQDYFSGARETWGIPTGFSDIDAVLGGLPIGEMTLIAADPGMGKTTLATDILLNATKRGNASAFFSLEMRRSQIMLRVFGDSAGVETSAIRRNRVTEKEKEKIFDAGGALEKLPLWIYDMPMDTAAVHRSILRLQRRTDLKLAVVDYSDLLKDRAESEVVRMKNISHALKNIAKQTGMALVVVHPITRDASRQDEAPDLHHLGWGRAWEYDAHTVIFPFFKKARTDFTAIIKIGKFRDGVSGKGIDMTFNGKRWGGLAR